MMKSKILFEYTKDLTLLFAEDHDQVRESTTEILKNFFKRVDSAANGDEAFKLYKNYMDSNDSNSYDIVLTDIKMPKMNGVVLTENIYKLKPEQIVVVLSAHEEAKYLLPLINLGINKFVQKPIDFQELLSILLKIAKNLTEKRSENATINLMFKMKDNVSYDRENKVLRDGDEAVYLTKYEILFMDLLTSSQGKIYSNNDIVEYYNLIEESIDPKNIRKLVSKLRKKLPENTLESIYGVGYRIV